MIIIEKTATMTKAEALIKELDLPEGSLFTLGSAYISLSFESTPIISRATLFMFLLIGNDRDFYSHLIQYNGALQGRDLRTVYSKYLRNKRFLESGTTLKYKHMAVLIRNKRRSQGYNQQKLGELLGIPALSGRSLFNSIELGTCSIPVKYYKELCQILNIDIEELKQAYINDKVDQLNRAIGKLPEPK